MRKINIETKTKLIIEDIEGFYKKKVTPFGNSAKVDCPREHIGKNVYLIINIQLFMRQLIITILLNMIINK